ncbi:MAG: formylglycine-generating enzyme family protein [Candidatus Thiodiazotropha sp.]
MFCNKLSELAGFDPVYDLEGKDININLSKNGYRMLTETEWEYCCRAGEGGKDRYDAIEESAWYNANSSGETHAVGEKHANDFGLYDMLGNVWEWCNDWYQRRYPEGNLVDYQGPKSGFERVLRGGSWNDISDCVRSSFRHRRTIRPRESTHGLRLARTHIDSNS